MLRLLRSKRAQNTAEYAILFAVVVGAFTAMQIYVKRGLNARIKDGTNTIPGIVAGQEGGVAANLFTATSQYEPYYIRDGAVNMQTVSSQGNEREAMSADTAGVASGVQDLTAATNQRTGSQTLSGVQNE